MTQTKPIARSEQTNRQRNAIIIGWAIGIFGALLILWGFYSLAKNPDIVHYILIGLYALLMATGFLDVWLSRRGQSDVGSLVVIGLLVFIVVAGGALLTGLGLSFLLLSVFMVSGVSFVALSPRYRAYTISSSILAGLLALFFDLFVTADWRSPALSPGVGWGISAVVIILYLVLLLVQARHFSLRTKLLTAFLIICLAAIALVSGLTNTATQIQLTTAANSALQAGAAQTGDLLDTFIQNNLDALRVEAQNTDIITFLQLPASEQDSTETAAEVDAILQSYVRRDPIFISSCALLDSQGVDLMDTYRADIGSNKAQRFYFQEPLKTGLPYVSPVEFSATTSESSLYFSAPVRNNQGEVLGVLRVRYDARILQKIVFESNGQAGEGSFAILLDEYHIRLAHGTSRENIGKSVVPLAPTLVSQLKAEGRLADLPAEELATDLPDFEAGLVQAGQNPYFRTPLTVLKGGYAQGAVHRLKYQPWTLVFFQPEEIFLQPVQAQSRMIIVLAVLIAGLIAVAALVVARTLTTPIVRLTHVAEEIAVGNLTAQAVVQTEDEVGTLAQTFNTMTARLRDTINAQEQTIAQRTRALQTSSEVSRRLSTILDSQRLVREVVDQLQSAFGYYHAHIYLFDPAKQSLLMAGGTGDAGRTMLARGHKIERGRGLVGRAAETNQIVLVPDVSLADGWLPNPLLTETKAEVAVPIAIGTNVLGVLDVQHNVTGGLNEQDADLIQAIANQVAIALQNARAYDQSRSQAEFETLVNTINQKIQRATSVDDVLQIAAREVGQALEGARVRASLQSSQVRDDQTNRN
jgi:putative methionine-R-sulfoxide reductase with GAF domain